MVTKDNGLNEKEEALLIKMFSNTEKQFLNDIAYYKRLCEYKFVLSSQKVLYMDKIEKIENRLIFLKNIQTKLIRLNVLYTETKNG